MSVNKNDIEANGLLVMDTCSFVNYIKGAKTKAFDYRAIKDFVKERGLLVAVTPHTVLECFLWCDNEKKYKERREDLMNVGHFWILNVNGILGDDFGLMRGEDFVFLKMTNQDGFETFAKHRNELRSKVNQSLYPIIIGLAQLIASVIVIITEQNEDGTYPKETNIRLKYINSSYFREMPNLKFQLDTFFKQVSGNGSFIDNKSKRIKDAKDFLKVQIPDMIDQILAISQVQTHAAVEKKKLNFEEYNTRIAVEYMRIEGKHSQEEMKKVYSAFEKRNKGSFYIGKFIVEALKGEAEVIQNLFEEYLTDWFRRSGFGKKMFNSLIDFTNLGMIEVLKGVSVIYMTEDDKFVNVMRGLKGEDMKLTQEFYKRYYTA